jgi:thiol-disulfide isomerase/thioredoxin
MQAQMRARGAPEARGFSFSCTWFRRKVSGLLALLALATASPIPDTARAEPVAAPLRRLAAVPGPDKPRFTLPDLAGTPLKLEEQRGRVVLLHFFATWCEPCREELSSLSHLQQGPLGKRVIVLAVNVAEVPVRVLRFLDAAPVNFPVVLDTDRTVTRAWSVGVLPTTFVLDPDLRPKLFVEGDLDWSRPDVLAELDSVSAVQPTEISTPTPGSSQ